MGGIIEMVTNNLEQYKGKFFSSHSVSGTAISTATAPTTDPPSATEGLISIYNTQTKDNSSANNTIIIPLYVRIKIDTAGAGGTASKLIIAKDTIKRYSSGGTLLTTNQTRAGTDSAGAVTPTAAKAQLYAGALTLAAASASYQVGRADIHPKSVGFIAGDVIELVFGDYNLGGQNMATVLVQKYCFGMAPVFLEPTTSLIIQAVITGQTNLSKIDVEVGHLEIKNGSVY